MLQRRAPISVPQAVFTFLRSHFLLTLLFTAMIAFALGVTLAFPGDAVKTTGVMGATEASQPVAALTITSSVPTQLDWPRWIEASGAIAPWQEVIVGPLVAGLRLLEIKAEVGDTVERGQLLARYDDSSLRSEENELMAGLAEAKANLAEAQANRERALAMKRSSALSEQAVLQYITQAATAEAKLQSAEARLASKRLQISYTRVLAPESGIVSARDATLGAVSQPGQELFRVIRDQRLEWRGELTSRQLAQVKPGQQVQLTLPNGYQSVAVIRQLAPAMEERSRLGTVYADIAANGPAKAGMFADGQIVLGQQTALVVPAESVVIRDGRSYVFILKSEQNQTRVQRREVSTGRRMGAEVEILGGLEPGVRIAVSGAGFLNDRDWVRVVSVAPTKGGEQ